ncbi:MFS transporter [Amycolatopsis jejuensis]|uniref:MFS transporter n=1 Tax=Amycolatopsis jejuensis TaxID=330084 RepID=UPI00068EC97E|nr:MFS transporter [Amycolatopsis jejuensis]
MNSGSSLSPATRTATASLSVLAAALFVYSMLESQLSPALPQIQTAVGASTTGIAWVFTGLLLSAAVSTPLVGRLADVHDKRSVLLGVLTIVAVGILVSALAPNVYVLAAGQILQGVGLSLMSLAVGIIRDSLAPGRIASSTGFMVGMASAGQAVALVLVGPILLVLDYTWLYWIPLVVIGIAIVAAWIFVPSCPPVKQERVDWPGAALLGTGLALVLLGLSVSPAVGWGSPVVLGLLVVGLLVIAGFTMLELRRRDPLVDVALLKNRAVLVTSANAFVVGLAAIVMLVLVPIAVQLPAAATGYGLGGSVLESGLFLLPLGLVGAVTAPVAARVERLLGARAVLLIGSAAIAAGSLLLIAAPGRPWIIPVATGLGGLCFAFGLTQVMNNVVWTVPADRTSSLSALMLVARSVGGTLGAQLGAVFLALSADPVTQLPTWSGFRNAFLLAGAASVAALLITFALPARLGSPESVRGKEITAPLAE